MTRLLRRWYHAHRDAYPEWNELLADGKALWEMARTRSVATGDHILISTAVGSYAHAVTLESALAVALRLRGAEPHVLLCDSALPACAECDFSLYPDLQQFIDKGPSGDLCNHCYTPAQRVYSLLGIRIHQISTLVSSNQRRQALDISKSVPFEKIKDLMHDGLNVGEHAFAGALRFFATGSLDREPNAEPVLRRYLYSALVTMFATRRLLKDQEFTCAVFTHGIYVPWGVIGQVCRQVGIRIANWNVAYRKRRFIFSHGDTYHHTLMSEPKSAWESVELTEHRERTLLDYLSSRRDGLFDWIVFHRASAERKPNQLAETLALDSERPIIGLLTNVSWDAQLHYPANAFPDMLDWIVRTCDYFSRRSDLQLLIRVHPAEISGFPRSRQPVLQELFRRCPELPSNITIVPPESSMSTYSLMSLCNAAIIYGTKMGVELASVGLPVIVAGEAWVRNKGVTHDASTAEEYFDILDRLPFSQSVQGSQLQRARQYAYHFFFRRMIPLPFVKPRAGYPIYVLALDRLETLLPGVSPGLDVICDGILSGRPFTFEEERSVGKSASTPH